MANSIHTVKSRITLAARAEPHWHRIASGQHLGYRKAESGPGSWIAKHRDEATGKRQTSALGEFAHLPDAERFDAAIDAARTWFKHLAGGGKTGRDTVADVCAAYVANQRTKGKHSAAADAERRFAQYVTDDAKFAAREVSKLTAGEITKWRTRLQQRPTPKGKPRTESSLNRDITPFRAALNFAADNRIVTSDASWAITLRAADNADKRRTDYPSREEIDRIIAAAEPELAEFLLALAMVPVRPGAMAQLVAGDFNKSAETLTIPTDKANENRTIKLPPRTAAHFAKHCANKLPSTPIFTKDGNPWTKDRWKTLFKVAVIAAGVQVFAKEPTEINPAQRLGKARAALRSSELDTKLTLYSFRHSVITSLVESGLAVQTIAQLSGTSPRMIHQNYGHLTDRASVDALARLAR
jgi:integrase